MLSDRRKRLCGCDITKEEQEQEEATSHQSPPTLESPSSYQLFGKEGESVGSSIKDNLVAHSKTYYSELIRSFAFQQVPTVEVNVANAEGDAARNFVKEISPQGTSAVKKMYKTERIYEQLIHFPASILLLMKLLSLKNHYHRV